MKQYKVFCNVCGKELEMHDRVQNFGMHERFGYGSKFDGDSIDLDICCDCFEKLMDKLIPICKINPIVPEEEIVRRL